MGHGLVDCHSHVLPSGDDGARTVADGLWLCADAAGHGTRILFGTPHVWPSLPLTASRRRAIEAALETMRRSDPALELRLGWELTPHRALLGSSFRDYVLEGTGHVLIEVPFTDRLDTLLRLLDEIEEQGLAPVVAHPERGEAVQDDPALLEALEGPGRLLQVNASSLLGAHGPLACEIGWELLESGRAALVASDGHRPSRPARLAEACRLATERLGDEAVAFFDGSALGLAGDGPRTPPAPSHASSPGA